MKEEWGHAHLHGICRRTLMHQGLLLALWPFDMQGVGRYEVRGSEIGPARRDWACTSEGRGVRRTDSKSPSDGRLSRCVQLEGWRIGAPHDRVECTGAEQSGHGACYGATDVAEPLGSRWALDGVHLEFTRAGVSVLRCTLPLGTTCSHVERASQSKQKNTCHSYIIKTT